MDGNVGMGQHCGSEQTPNTEKPAGDQTLLGECREGDGRIGGSPLVTPLLLQFCLTWFSCGEGRRGGPGDKERKEKRRLTFFL